MFGLSLNYAGIYGSSRASFHDGNWGVSIDIRQGQGQRDLSA